MDDLSRLQHQVAALLSENARLTALLAERDAEIARLKLTTRSDREYAEQKQRAEEAEGLIARLVAERDDLQSQSDRLEDDVLYLLRRASALRSGLDAIHARMARSRINDDSVGPRAFGALSDLLVADDAALAARGGEVQG